VAELALWQGDPAKVRSLVEEGMRLIDALPAVVVDDLGWACALGLRAEAELAVGARTSGSIPDLDQSREIASGLLARARALQQEVADRRPYHAPRAEAWLATCEAEATRLGNPDPDLWAVASAAWGGLEIPYLRAYSLMREAEAALAGRRDRRRAAQLLTAARTIAVQLGAEPLRSAIESLAGRNVRTPGSRAEWTAGTSWDIRDSGRPLAEHRTVSRLVNSGSGLTPREGEVLGLLAEGRSDAEIAEALFISKKTASSHVAHIKDKLEAGSRVEIVVIAIGLGLVDSPTAQKP
jgi:DNA-binding CsgD family transcriptional regulator